MHAPPNDNTNAHDPQWLNKASHEHRSLGAANSNEDPNTVWIRHDIEEIFNNYPAVPLTGLHRIAQIVALTNVLTFFILTIVMALTARL